MTSGPIVHDFPTWVKDMARRVELLERRRQRVGATSGGGTGGNAVGVSVSATFAAGRATVPLPAVAAGKPIVSAGFAEPVGAGVDARVNGDVVELYGSVSNATYTVNLIFVVAG